MHPIRHLIQNTDVAVAPPAASVYEVARAMTEARVGAIMVVDQGRVLGIFTERDLMTRVVVPGLDPELVPVSAVATPDVIYATPEMRRADAIDMMRRAGCRHLPVIEDGAVVAMLSMRDLLRDEIEETTEELNELRDYLHSSHV
jgi:CBS domain-containing protein